MKCPHCHTSIHANWAAVHLTNMPSGTPIWLVQKMLCPECRKDIFLLRHTGGMSEYLIFPRFPTRAPVPKEVPIDIAEDYIEACATLSISPKASAALSRRCLQGILSTHGYTATNLARQIDNVLAETDARKALSPALSATIDAVRNFGNFSAHPITDVTTSQIIPVEEHEAEFCLEIIEEMFDHFYVRPAIAAKRKADLDAKLAAGGKPPSK